MVRASIANIAWNATVRAVGGMGSKHRSSRRDREICSAGTSAKTDKELLRTIAQGKSHTAMPAWQEVLSAEDQQAALHYIRSLVRFTRPPAPPVGTP